VTLNSMALLRKKEGKELKFALSKQKLAIVKKLLSEKKRKAQGLKGFGVKGGGKRNQDVSVV